MVKKAAYATPNRRLRAARLERGWTQQQVADRIGAPLSLNVSRWENGTAFPSAYYIERLCQLFGKSVRELGLSRLEDESQGQPSAIPGEPAPPSSVQEERTEQGPLASIREYPAQGVYRASLLTIRDDSLPLPLTPLIGREEEVASVCALLRQPDVRLVTLSGTGGIGKTRLALRVAAELRADFANGVCFVSLAAFDDPALVVSTILQALGLKESEHRTPLDLVQAALRDKRLLLLLDNFERLLPAASQMTVLLTGCPQLKILVTSRAVLHVQGEFEFSVSPLALPELEALPALEALASIPAVALFLERARAVRPAFRLTEANARAIAEICVRLDGLPLAIELAAARSKLLSPQELLVRLSHRLEVLTGGQRDLPVRQQTLRDTISWSYQLLDEAEQRLFRRLSVFTGGCTLEAAEAVCSAPGNEEAGHFLEPITSLLDKSLLQTIQQEGKESRLLMLETIREYGLEALVSCGEAQTIREAHVAYYLALAEQAEPELTGPQQFNWFERLEQEHDNLRAALSWLLEQGSEGQSKELALRFGGALARFWRTRGYVSEGRRWLERALNESSGVSAAVRAKALTAAGHLADLQDDVSQAEVLCGEGLGLYRELGDRRGSATALTFLGYAALLKSNYAQARARLEEALTLFKEVGDTVDRVLALGILGSVLVFQGEYTRAQALLEESLMLSETAGDVRDRAFSLRVLGTLLLFQGDLVQAQARLEESRVISREVGYKRNLGLANHMLGLIAFRQGDMTGACSLLEESLGLLREVGERGRMAEVFASQGLISLSQGDYTAARARLEESLKISLKLDNKWVIAGGLEGVAAVLAAQGESGRAVRCMSAAQALREAIGTTLPSIFQPMHEFTIASVRAQLGEQAFAAAWAEGRLMTLEQVFSSGEPAV